MPTKAKPAAPPPDETPQESEKISEPMSSTAQARYIQNSLISCDLTVTYGRVTITLGKRVYSEAKDSIELAAEYDLLELELEDRHREFRVNHLSKYKPDATEGKKS